MAETTPQQAAPRPPMAVSGSRGLLSPYADADSFATAQRIAQSLAASTMVPAHYRGPENVANCLIAIELAHRIGASVFAVMQNCDIINGQPSWRAQFIIGAINACGRFQPLRFAMAGEGKDRRCMAWTRNREGEMLEGPTVSMAMAKAEGWLDRKGSKWKTMPEIMLRYRAASFFGRLYAPDVLTGMQTVEEVQDTPIDLVETAEGVYVPRAEAEGDDPAGDLMRNVRGEPEPEEGAQEEAPESAPERSGAPESARDPTPTPTPSGVEAPIEPPADPKSEQTPPKKPKTHYTANELAAAIARAETLEEWNRINEVVNNIKAKRTRERLAAQLDERFRELGLGGEGQS